MNFLDKPPSKTVERDVTTAMWYRSIFLRD